MSTKFSGFKYELDDDDDDDDGDDVCDTDREDEDEGDTGIFKFDSIICSFMR
jgi:hypothetical protein